METFLLEVARTWKLFYFIATNRNKWYKQYGSVKQFTRLLKMFKQSATKMLKAFKLLQHAKQLKLPSFRWKHGNFQRHRVWMAFNLTCHGNFHRQNDSKEYFYGIFHAT